ncbi:hypothetical protein [Crocosphaera sp. Alani8]
MKRHLIKIFGTTAEDEEKENCFQITKRSQKKPVPSNSTIILINNE